MLGPGERCYGKGLGIGLLGKRLTNKPLEPVIIKGTWFLVCHVPMYLTWISPKGVIRA